MSRARADERAIALYARVREDPRSIGLLLAALKVCRSSRDLETGRKIHAHAISSGVAASVVVANILIDMYSKCGALAEARQVFDAMETRDVVSWTSIIQGLARNGEFELALALYDRMLRDPRDGAPDRLALLAAIKACVGLIEKNSWNAKIGRKIHARAARSGDESDAFVAAALVDMYAKSKSFSAAFQVFSSQQSLHVVSWTSIVLGAVSSGDSLLALNLFSQMREEGCEPDSIALTAALKACASLAEQEHDAAAKKIVLCKGRSLHRLLKNSRQLDLASANTLIDMYAKCGNLDDALYVFESLSRRRRSSVTWNCMILGAVINREPELALNLFSRMEEEGNCVPDRITLLAALKACASLGALDLGRRLEARILSSSPELRDDPTLRNALVDFYGKSGSMSDAQRVFNSITAKNLVAWSSLIAGYSNTGDAERVFDLFQGMEREDRLTPDAITYLSVLSVCSRSGLVEEAKHYFEAMRSKHKIEPCIEHYTCMVRLLGQANYLDEARETVASMPLKADDVIWMVLLECCRQWKNLRVGKFAFDCVMELDSKKSTAYVLMSNIYADVGLVDESFRIKAMQIKAGA